MRKFFLATSVLVLSLLFCINGVGAVNIDMSESNINITGPTSFRLECVKAGGQTYWADFKWNPGNNNFVLSTYGEDTSCNNGCENVIGTWNLSYDWDCDGGSLGNTTITFNEDGTFVTGENSGGIWTCDGGKIVFTFDNGTEYIGTVSGNSMSGTMVRYDGARTGCWSATSASPGSAIDNVVDNSGSNASGE